MRNIATEKYTTRNSNIENTLVNETEMKNNDIFMQELISVVKEEGGSLMNYSYVNDMHMFTNTDRYSRTFVARAISYSVIICAVIFIICLGKLNAQNNIHNVNAVGDISNNNTIIELEPIATESLALAIDRYQENPVFENLIGQVTRINNNLSSITPLSSQAFNNQDIVFSWESNTDDKIYLKICDNEENEVVSISAVGNVYKIDSSKLNMGIFYWKIENDEKLLHLGKIIIK